MFHHIWRTCDMSLLQKKEQLRQKHMKTQSSEHLIYWGRFCSLTGANSEIYHFPISITYERNNTTQS